MKHKPCTANSLGSTIAALLKCGELTEQEVMNKTPGELFKLASKKTLQIAIGSRETQTKYRDAFNDLRTKRTPGNGSK